MSNSLVNLGDITKPAEVLINRVSDAIGGIAKPWQIQRVAKAEAEAAVIKATAEIEIGDLQKRAVQRFVNEQTTQQINMETIAAKALPHVKEEATPEKIEQDWITNFFDKCRLISDEKMQELWSKILAHEANEPGTCSRRTVAVLSELERADAELFTKFLGVCWNFGKGLIPLVFDANDNLYRDAGIYYASLMHLDAIGLIRFNSQGNLYLRDKRGDLVAKYGAHRFLLRVESEDGCLRFGTTVLTNAGRDVARCVSSIPLIAGFPEYVQKCWKPLGVEIVKSWKE